MPEMKSTPARAHLGEVFRWSSETKPDWISIFGLVLGMAGPLVVAGHMGDLRLGLPASFAAMMVGCVGVRQARSRRMAALVNAAVPALVVSLAAPFVAGDGWPGDVAIVALAGLAGLIGGFSRPLAIATARLIPFLIIAATLAGNVSDRPGFALVMAAGVIWTVLVNLVVGVVTPWHPGEGVEEQRRYTFAQKYRRWRRTLRTLAGWQYALRLVVCLGIAELVKHLVPNHHLYWIALTVALLVERHVETFPVKTTQRAIGTAIGVVATSLLLFYRLPAWALVAGIAALAGLRPVLRARNYLAYSATMTPLIILIMDAGRLTGADVLVERLVATLAGAALVIVVNGMFAHALERSSP